MVGIKYIKYINQIYENYQMADRPNDRLHDHRYPSLGIQDSSY
jgi:hypothetical protein